MKGFKKDQTNNFKTIDEVKNHYSSVSKLAYCDYGDSRIKATLDEDRRLDLRRSHFKVGKEKEVMYSHTQSSYRPITVHISRNNISSRGAELRASNWSIGDLKRIPPP